MAPLRIGIDARELIGDTTGAGRYLGELLRRWVARPDAAARVFTLYSPDPLPWAGALPGVEPRILGGGRGTWWEQTRLRRALAQAPPDVFFAPAYTAPWRVPCPLVATIHDVSYAAHPEWFSWREGTRRRLLSRRAARNAAAVLTISEFSRGEIAKHFDVAPERITVVPPGVSTRAAVEVPREPLVLFVGSIFNRRRVPELVAAFARVARQCADARLVIAGANRTHPHLDIEGIVRAQGVPDRIAIREYVDDDELPSLYGRASVFVFLSEYEGFGMTPVEALASGVPIVVLDTPVAREVYGAAATYVDPRQIERQTADAVVRLLGNPEAREAALAPAASVLSRYSWDAAADRVLALLEASAAPKTR
jgi:glycosyltransferase involved in cell wall biosynthesis